MRKIIKNESELYEFANDIARKLKNKKSKQTAVILGLTGELGAGKTAFVKAVARALGVREILNSPTFVIMKKYPIIDKKYPWDTLVHIDAYRMEGAEELDALGWNELVKNPKNIIFIEWAEKIKAMSDETSMSTIYFGMVENRQERILTIPNKLNFPT